MKEAGSGTSDATFNTKCGVYHNRDEESRMLKPSIEPIDHFRKEIWKTAENVPFSISAYSRNQFRISHMNK